MDHVQTLNVNISLSKGKCLLLYDISWKCIIFVKKHMHKHVTYRPYIVDMGYHGNLVFLWWNGIICCFNIKQKLDFYKTNLGDTRPHATNYVRKPLIGAYLGDPKNGPIKNRAQN